MKKLLWSPSVRPIVAISAINLGQIAENTTIMHDNPSSFSDLCAKMKLQLTEPPQL